MPNGTGWCPPWLALELWTQDPPSCPDLSHLGHLPTAQGTAEMSQHCSNDTTSVSPPNLCQREAPKLKEIFSRGPERGQRSQLGDDPDVAG